jgi:SAM-dependent methyltransferase
MKSAPPCWIFWLGQILQQMEKASLPRRGKARLPASRTVSAVLAPLVLLPLFLAPSQWEPLIPRLSEKYRTITLGGIELGTVTILESRGRAMGYLQMVRTLIDETRLRPGETVLEVGCGTGVLDRWLAHDTGGAHRIVGVDINRYLLQEAGALSRKEGLEDTIEYREGSAEALPFPDNSFDVTMSVTVIEEVDAKHLLAEMVRVTKPRGRVAVIARSVDIPFLMNLPLCPPLKAKVEATGMNFANIEEHGCADASLYRRFHQAGLTQVKMLPSLQLLTVQTPPLCSGCRIASSRNSARMKRRNGIRRERRQRQTAPFYGVAAPLRDRDEAVKRGNGVTGQTVLENHTGEPL